jgi:hypothetical protein
MGRGGNAKDDELVVDADDSYDYVPEKLKLAYQWVLDNGYDYVFQCDVDTYVAVPRLLESGFQGKDYIGNCYNYYAQGGAGYWLSARSVRAHVEDTTILPKWSDVWCGDVLRRAGIGLVHDDRYWPWGARSEDLKNIITVHLSKIGGGYDPSWMFWQHDRILESMR